ncbi:DoxX family protein [Leptospira ilyithenensis]|uniref:DoxX family protein n=1 Tax=Leptospira ilyithenensis TaxID=2484901 RepID=A0A4R9LP38_9LEPT|nr:DoxX family protein [Leptospira ilyithenensis]TGN09700.1 DoxX family protein [Leptospira ilyithenensis]
MNKEKIKTIAYWVITILIGANYLFAGFIYLTRNPEVLAGMAQLGYPSYFPFILGTWKLLGGIAIMVPGFALLKEWAYAGMFFNLTSAAISSAVSGLEIQHVISPLVMLVFVILSWWLRPENRKLTSIKSK